MIFYLESQKSIYCSRNARKNAHRDSFSLFRPQKILENFHDPLRNLRAADNRRNDLRPVLMYC